MNNIESFQTGNNSIVVEGTVVKVNENATLDDWKSFGEKIKKAENGIQWILGAWWNYGHEKWSSVADEFVGELGYRRATLHNYGSIYKRVTSSRRREFLSFRHHEDVAALPPAKQVYYLEKAEKEGLSSDNLREVIRKAERPELKEEPVRTRHYITEIRLTALLERVEGMAKQMNVQANSALPGSWLRGEIKEVLKVLYGLRLSKKTERKDQ